MVAQRLLTFLSRPFFSLDKIGTSNEINEQLISFSSCLHLHLCLSRANTTNENQECRSVNTDTVEINLSNACEGHGMIHHCPPLFISVEGTRVHDGQNLRCTERECRFPDNARFEIITDNLGCYSSVGKIFASIVLVLASILVTIRV